MDLCKLDGFSIIVSRASRATYVIQANTNGTKCLFIIAEILENFILINKIQGIVLGVEE